MELTKEQKSIVNYHLRQNDILKVIAFAGTGKTTTLVEYTRCRPRCSFLYIAFNKSVQLEALGKFPAYVTCKTSHSLAWPDFGSKYKHKIVPSLKANTVMKALGLDGYEDAKFTLETLNRYLTSADKKISKRHIPPLAWQYYELKKHRRPNLVRMAGKLWSMMCDQDNRDIGMLHDGYLKLYQLSGPQLDFDVIMLDEAQDINPVTADIVLSQQRPKILVGDPHQQIYSFRGAHNVMQGIEGNKTMYLTNSFRFGSKIASFANMILHLFKDETQKLIGTKGTGKICPVLGRYTILARTNAKVFDEAVDLYKEQKIGFVGGIAGYRFGLIRDTYYLYSEQMERISDGYIRSFKNYYEMKEFAKAVEDWELISRCNVVEKYRHKIPTLVREITDMAVDAKIARVLLSTAHKSKGLEFDKVRLADDFSRLLGDNGPINKENVDPDEFNLIYVSITRAKETLEISPALKEFRDFIRQYQDNSGFKKELKRPGRK